MFIWALFFANILVFYRSFRLCKRYPYSVKLYEEAYRVGQWETAGWITQEMANRLLNLANRILNLANRLLNLANRLLNLANRLLNLANRLLNLANRLLNLANRLLNLANRLLNLADKFKKKWLHRAIIIPHIYHISHTLSHMIGMNYT